MKCRKSNWTIYLSHFFFFQTSHSHYLRKSCNKVEKRNKFLLQAQYIYQDSKLVLDYSRALVNSIPSWLVWPEIEFTVSVYVTLLIRPINQFKPVSAKQTTGNKSLLSKYISCAFRWQFCSQNGGSFAICQDYQIPPFWNCALLFGYFFWQIYSLRTLGVSSFFIFF